MLSRLITGVCAVAGSVAGAQFPALYSQYLHHVSGRLTQVLRDLEPVLQAAQARGLSVEDYLRRAAQEKTDYSAASVAGDIRAAADLKTLEAAYAALSGAGPAMQPVAFARHAELATLEMLLRDFTPGLPLSLPGLAYGGVGLLLGLMVAWVLESPLRVWQDHQHRRRRGRRRRAAPAAPRLDKGSPE